MYPIAAREGDLRQHRNLHRELAQKKPEKRDELVIATKIAGPNRNMGLHPRKARLFTREHLVVGREKVCSGYRPITIDLYQFHWPERKVNFLWAARFLKSRKMPGKTISTRY